MNYQPPTKSFAQAPVARSHESSSDDYELVVRQEPVAAKVFIGKEKVDRKPVDPPPIIQLRVSESVDPLQNYLQSPYFFVSCSMLDDYDTRSLAENDDIKHGLAGTLVSSLHKLKDTDNTDGGFFIFGDLSVRVEGTFRLQFTLYEVRDKEVAYINSVTSGSFNVFAPKNWPGMAESTFLTRSFSDQGVRLRLRKEPRARLGVRGPASDNYEPRRYKLHNRRQSQTDVQQPHQMQQAFHWNQESIGAQTQTPVDYSTRHNKQQLSSSSPVFPGYQGKRDYSQSAHFKPHASQDEEPLSKRVRTESEQTHQQPYTTQQYSLSPEYGGRIYSHLNQSTVAAFPSSPHQFYNSNFSSSPPSTTPRNQTSYFTARRADAQFPSITSTYESPLTRISNSQPQRFLSGYDYTTPAQPVSQVPDNLQQPLQSQQQYTPQIVQPMPSGRKPIGTPMYNIPMGSEQPSMLPRPHHAFSRATMPAIVSSNAGATVLPSMGGDLKYMGSSMFDFKSKDSANH